MIMKIAVQLKLCASPEQVAKLKETLEVANAACDYISELAWERKVFRQFPLHRLAYKVTREKFTLAAQMVVRAIAKVSNGYKLDKDTRRTFKTHGAIAYDDRILSWKLDQSEVSIWTTQGRVRVNFVCGPRQRELLSGERGETDLCLVRGTFYLFVACEVETPEPIDVNGVLGVDLGIVNLAADSDGELYSGEQVEKSRQHYAHIRQTCQSKDTKSATRKLKRLSGRQARFQKNTNHVISKRVVQKAQDTARTIALEDLSGITRRTTARVQRKQRAKHVNWSFYQLRQFITYKAQLAGIGVILVDPAFTSQTCPICGCVDKRNRPSQGKFLCVQCSFSGCADTVGAVNIASRAAVSQPIVSALFGPGTSPSPLGLGN